MEYSGIYKVTIADVAELTEEVLKVDFNSGLYLCELEY